MRLLGRAVLHSSPNKGTKTEQAIKADILPKKALANCTLDIYTGAANFPNAYKYAPQGTHCKIKYNKKGEPELIDVDRANVNHLHTG